MTTLYNAIAGANLVSGTPTFFGHVSYWTIGLRN